MDSVIFTIDFENNPLRMNVFMNRIAEAKAFGQLRGDILPMLGKYNGKAEHCFICTLEDFDNHIRGSEYIKRQESILLVASGNKMEVGLEYLATGRVVDLGCMHEVCPEEAAQAPAWSYRPDMGVYWIAKKGNPDDSYARSVKKYRRAPMLSPVHAMPIAAE